MVIFKNKINTRKVLNFLLFLLVSTIAWFFVRYSDTFQDEVAVDVLVTDIPDHIKIAENENPSIHQLLLEDTGYKLLYYKLIPPQAEVAFKDAIVISDTMNYIDPDKIYESLSKNSKLGLKVVEMHEEMMPVDLSFMDTKKVVIRNSLKTEYLNGYQQSGNVVLTPDSVLLTGSKSQLERINEIVLQEEEMLISSKETQTKIKIPVDPDIFMAEPDSVMVTVNAAILTEGSIKLTVKTHGIPTDKMIKTIPEQVEVIYSCTIDDYETISAKNFEVLVNYSSLKSVNSTLTPELRVTSDKVINARLVPPQIQVLVIE